MIKKKYDVRGAGYGILAERKNITTLAGGKRRGLFTKMGAIIMAASVMMCAACGGSSFDISKIKTGNKVAGLSVHDPAIVSDGEKYYIFGSHMAAGESSDLINWKSFADGVNKRNPVLGSLFDDMKAFDYVDKFTDGGYAVWAPDVFYNETMGKWVMYFCTSHDYMTSNLCLAVADDVKGPYTYVDTLLYSGFTSKTVEKTNFYDICGEDANVRKYLNAGKYNNLKYPNCIDANIITDKDGGLWLSYGSWSGGIWLLRVDPKTGLLIHPEENEDEHIDKYFGKYLIGGLHNSCEGPYIYYDKNSDFYYLTVSFGELTREGGYQIRVFRSENVDGPYVDNNGETFGYVSNHSGNGLKLIGNYSFPSLKTAYKAPGHNSVLQDKDGRTYIVYHQRFDKGNEYHEPRVHQMFLNKSTWPVVAPFATMGESLKESGYSQGDIEGTWFFLSHGTDISSEIHAATETTLKGGKVKGAVFNGSYELDGQSVYMSVTVDDITYDGVIVDMEDEAGNQVRCFMGCGNNESVWGVKYLN